MSKTSDPPTHGISGGFLPMHAGAQLGSSEILLCRARPRSTAMEWAGVRNRRHVIFVVLVSFLIHLGYRNCYSTHLLRYTIAKLLIAVKRMERLQTASSSDECLRLSAEGEMFFTKCWTEFIKGIGISSVVHKAAYLACLRLAEVCMCKEDPLQVDDWECLRSFFRAKGSPTSL